MTTNRIVQVNSEKLKQIRELLCWSQMVAGMRAGYSARLIRKLESGSSVKRSTLVDVVAAYNEGIAESPALELPLLTFDECILHVDSPESVAREWFHRIFNLRDLKAIEDLVSPNVRLIAEGQELTGKEQVRTRIEAILNGFDPLTHTVEDIVADGEKLVIYWSVVAVHSGVFFGINATKRRIFIRGSTMAVIREGVFIEARDHWDAKELLDQLS